jgi:polyphosphate kinase
MAKKKEEKLPKKKDKKVEVKEKVKKDIKLNYEAVEDKKIIDKHAYEKEIYKLQIELIKLQEWVKAQKLKIVVIFEGRDAAGKGGVIKTITERLNPRFCRVVALGVPTEKEKTQWYFQRYVPHLPAAGEIVLFDRSWYNRAGVERVMGYCTEQEYLEFLRSCPEFERMLVRSGIMVVKYWFSVSDKEQENAFWPETKIP